jgi:potassium-transporting ATPase KdpC subunit
MFAQLRPAIVALLLLTLITGVLYPLAITGIAAAVFPHQAGGSILTDHAGHPTGSALIGQFFDDPRCFWPRPSATSPVPYTAFNADKSTSSSGSNLGSTNPALIQAVKDRIAALQKADPGNTAPIPVDLVTASASGLDPHISLAAAEYQVPRVARLRQMPENEVRRLVSDCTDDRQLGILGEPRVNVLTLNLVLNAAAPLATPVATSTSGME